MCVCVCVHVCMLHLVACRWEVMDCYRIPNRLGKVGGGFLLESWKGFVMNNSHE